MRILIFGNSGSGKTTMAHAISRTEGIPHLDLDSLAWDPGPVRRDPEASRADVLKFIQANEAWVIEGCYGDLIEFSAPYCTEMRFLNPGVDRCISNCRARPWEPVKYASAEEQDAMLDYLLGWVRAYETRTDEFSLCRHRQIFDKFDGARLEIIEPPEL